MGVLIGRRISIVSKGVVVFWFKYRLLRRSAVGCSDVWWGMDMVSVGKAGCFPVAGKEYPMNACVFRVVCV